MRSESVRYLIRIAAIVISLDYFETEAISLLLFYAREYLEVMTWLKQVSQILEISRSRNRPIYQFK